MKLYLSVNNLAKSKTNNNIGSRVTYLKCLFTGCPKKLRVVTNLIVREGIPNFEIEEVLTTDHNHQVDVPRERGLSNHQKSIVDLCVDRNQGAPKKVVAIQGQTSFNKAEDYVYHRLSGSSCVSNRLLQQLVKYKYLYQQFQCSQATHHIRDIVSEVVLPSAGKASRASWISRKTTC